jgi:2-succinyl-5-enolpyruvyl-6-hydroxy-3-cyclohexene-1-carboxylate synthase
LYQTVSKLEVDVTISAFPKEKKKISIDAIIEFTNIWNASKKKLILVGENKPDEIDAEIIDLLANDDSVVVMTETTSNLHHPSFLNNIDTIITPFSKKDFKNLQPDILITFGGMVVSKRIKAFLREFKPKHHWHIDQLRGYDTFGGLTKHFKVKPNLFFNQFLHFTIPIRSNYRSTYEKIATLRKSRHQGYLDKIPFSDFKVFGEVLPSLPEDCMLHLGNSSAIRYAQLFDINPSIQVFCNRGTSGIDGSTSTAIGAAVANERQTVLITGDIGFLYDSNALWNEYTPKNFKIILINNGGGGIFRILPGHEETPVFNKFFETSHCLTAGPLAKMYGFEYSIASDEASLAKSLKAFYSHNDKPCILEIFTPTRENDSILLQYFRELV